MQPDVFTTHHSALSTHHSPLLMPPSESWTVGRLLEWTADYLKNRGADSPRLDAEVLLAEALDCRRIELYTRYEEEPPEEARTAFRDFVKRRAAGTPVAYLVGRREFYSMDFRVGPAVLIPRPETELLVVALLDLAGTRAAQDRLEVADVGTGSGIIAVCAAKNLANARLTAVDVSADALEVARTNAAGHGVTERIEFIQSDLFAGVDPARRFDYIVSNPPYVSTAEMAALDPGVRDFEPHLALAAGQRGTEVIERLIDESANHLDPGGFFFFYLSTEIYTAAVALLEAEARFNPGPTIKDLSRLPRVVQATRN